jgi:CheY-like chemotaxis protein
MIRAEPTVLIVEDGDEYLENLSRFVPGPIYVQAHHAAGALAILAGEAVDLIYLDMRFDRVPLADLVGDHVQATREQNGDPVRAWRHLQNNQGLYILDGLRRAGHGRVPAILAYDFSREPRRYEHLLRVHPSLRWVPDAVTPAQIRSLMDRLLG